MNFKSIIPYLIILSTIFLSLGVVCAGENISSTHPEFLSVEESPIDVESEPVEIDNDVSTNQEKDKYANTDDNEILSATEEPIFEQENDESAITDDNEILSAGEGSFTELQNLIDYSAAGSTIILEKDYSYKAGDDTSGILITKNLIINGNGKTLDGKSSSRILNIHNVTNLILNNIKFINGNDSAVYSINSTITVNNSVFEKNVYAIYSPITYIRHSADRTTFIGNNLTVINSLFNDNYGGKYNDIFSYKIYLQNSVIGAVIDSFNVTLINSNFTNFHGKGHPFIATEYINAYNCNFINNTALAAPSLYATYANIDNCKFINNSAYLGEKMGYFASYDGGAAYILTAGNVTNSLFLNCSAGSYGGALGIGIGESEISNCTFKDTKSEYGGAIYVAYSINKEHSTKIKDCKFINNNASMQGGAIFSANPIYIENSTFNDCNAKVGGAVSVLSIGSLDDCTFNNNKAYLGNDIAFKNTFDGLELSDDTKKIYKLVSRVENKTLADLTDGFTLFLDNYTGFEDYYELLYIYPNFSLDDYWEPFVGATFYHAIKSEINGFFLPDYVYYFGLNLSDYRYGISEPTNQYDFYIYMKNKIFNESRWNSMKLNKINELLGLNLNLNNIPDNGFMIQINQSTFAFVDFELLQSVRPVTNNFEKNGVGYYSYWLPAYRLTYKDISEISNLTVEKISLNPTVNVGEVSSFDIIVKNTGLINLTGVFVSEIIPEGLTYISHSDSDVWIKTGDIFNYLKTLGVNETVRFTIDFNTTKIGNFTNVVIVGSNETGNKTANNTTEVVNKTETPENETEIPEETPGNNTEVENNPNPDGDEIVLRNDLGMGPVENNDTPADESASENETQTTQSETPENGGENVKVDKNATGNPILLAVLVLLTALTTLRRRD